jgi:hypothetical protein
MRADDKANYSLSENAHAQMENVRDSLQRRGISDAKVNAAGPGTAADMQAQGLLSGAIFGSNLGNKGGWLGRAGGATIGGLLGSAIGPMEGIAGAGIGAGISDAIGAVNNRIIAKTGQTAADSQASAEAIQRWLAKQPKGQRGLLEQYLFGAPATQGLLNKGNP